MLRTLESFARKQTHRVIGLMSGTSVDGIDAALCEISGAGRGQLKVKILGGHTDAFLPSVRGRILDACLPNGGSSTEICELNVLLGEEFAHAAKNAVQSAGLKMPDVDLIGSHGQTIAHHPPGSTSIPGAGIRMGSTLQIGCAAVIAERTGLPVVSNFRPRDMAAGGQGAPLVPYVDYLLFSDDTLHRATLNIGGIANVTWMPAGCGPESVVAFDTGPGNMILDALAAHTSGGRLTCDKDGAIASSGKVDTAILGELLAHSYFKRPLPKSAGREEFGADFATVLLEKGRAKKLGAPDIMATACAFTATSIAQALWPLALRDSAISPELIVAGGGLKNPTLMEMLRAELPDWKISATDRFGIPSTFRECAAFAILARETMLGRPSNLPGVTGARGPRVLGDITF